MKLNAGYLTLRRIEKLASLNAYIWQRISPYISGEDVLEIGSGVGVYTDFLLKARKRVLSIDVVPKVITALQRRFGVEYPGFEAMAIDASDALIAEKIEKRFDAVICLNVLEHIEDDIKTLSNIAQLLKSNGRLILLVPAFKLLYGSLDENLGHYRRYSYNEIESKLSQCGFSVEKHFYMHFMGIFGWFVRSRITKDAVLNKRDLKMYEYLMPLFKFMDNITLGLIGQSLVVISKVR